MTKPYALRRLLEHGPLTVGEIITITRWTLRQVRRAVDDLQADALLRTERIERGLARYHLV